MRWRRAGLWVLALVLSAAAAVFALPLAIRGIVRGLQLFLAGAVWLAASFGTGADASTIVLAVAGAAGRALLTTRALAVMGGLVLISALALYGLQRLLGLEEESSR
jgi:hypothetical protein